MSEIDDLYTQSGLAGWLNSPRQETREGFSVVVPPTKAQAKREMNNAISTVAGNAGVTKFINSKLVGMLDKAAEKSAALYGKYRSNILKTFTLDELYPTGKMSSTGKYYDLNPIEDDVLLTKRLEKLRRTIDRKKVELMKQQLSHTNTPSSEYMAKYKQNSINQSAQELKIMEDLYEEMNTFSNQIMDHLNTFSGKNK